MPSDLPAIALDLETHLIAPGLLAPPPVIGSVAWVEPGSERLVELDEFAEFFTEQVRGSELVIGANIAYDLGILAAYGYVPLAVIFDAYEAGRVYDVQIAQALDAIANGHLFKDPATGGALYVNGKRSNRYSLEACVKLCLGHEDAKANDDWRLRYAELEGVPLADWPADAKQYPLDDARNTMDAALVQLGQTGAEPYRNLHNMKEQAFAAWCLHLASMWGIRTDAKAVGDLRAQVEARHAEAVRRFTGVFLRGPEAKSRAGTEDQSLLKRAVAKAYGALGVCPVCGGTGKVASEKTGKPVTCKEGCDGTGLDLDTAPGLPRTEKGAISTNRDTLMESGDDTLEEYALVSEGEKLRGTYLPFVEKGARWPINVRSNVLVENGRASYDDVIQQMPKKGGVRETIYAPPGWLIGSDDYAAIELCTLAQAQLDILGQSTMAEMINDTRDPGSLHTAMAARMVGASFEELKARVKAGDKQAKDYRQAAKAANFGLPGGMGEATFVLGKRKRIEGTTWSPDGQVEYAGIRFCLLMIGAERCGLEKVTEWKGRAIPPTCVRCLECAADLRAVWFEQWPEMKPYFDFVSRQVDAGGEVVQLRSERVRGGLTFTNAANGYFSGLAADGAKEALPRVTREMYLDPSSPLYGSRLQFFAHDEFVALHPEAKAAEAATRMATVMEEAMRVYVPDVFVKAEPALMRHYSKSAEAVYDASGRLVPWEDREQAAKAA